LYFCRALLKGVYLRSFNFFFILLNVLPHALTVWGFCLLVQALCRLKRFAAADGGQALAAGGFGGT
jgi:hypothetical protein